MTSFDDPRAQAIEAEDPLLSEGTYVDIESAIHQHMGHDGQSDEANDWVTDLMAAITPFIERELRDMVDAIPGDVHAHLAQQKGGVREVFVLAEDIGYYTVHWTDGTPAPLDDAPLYRLVDPPQEAST